MAEPKQKPEAGAVPMTEDDRRKIEQEVKLEIERRLRADMERKLTREVRDRIEAEIRAEIKDKITRNLNALVPLLDRVDQALELIQKQKLNL